MLHQTTTHDNTTRRDERARRTEAATYAKIVQTLEARQKRLEAARKATAAFTGIDDGDILFA